jgi:hypothetical protein
LFENTHNSCFEVFLKIWIKNFKIANHVYYNSVKNLNTHYFIF